jgi:hypothetical protein
VRLRRRSKRQNEPDKWVTKMLCYPDRRVTQEVVEADGWLYRLACQWDVARRQQRKGILPQLAGLDTPD